MLMQYFLLSEFNSIKMFTQHYSVFYLKPSTSIYQCIQLNFNKFDLIATVLGKFFFLAKVLKWADLLLQYMFNCFFFLINLYGVYQRQGVLVTFFSIFVSLSNLSHNLQSIFNMILLRFQQETIQKFRFCALSIQTL